MKTYSNANDIIITTEYSIADAIERLNVTGRMFLIIADENRTLMGNLTDGDLRKGMLKVRDLNVSVSAIMNTSPITVPPEVNHDHIAQIFANGQIKALPVVDDNGIVLGCFFENDFREHLFAASDIMIMAGGFGMRMGDLTRDIPKPMLPVDGKPMLEHIIGMAASQGFRRCYISVHYLAEQIMDHFGDGRDFGIDIEYIREDKPLGTGGSIKRLPPGDTPVVVTNADIISKVNYKSMIHYHVLTKAMATIATHEHSMQNPFGVIEADGIRIKSLKEKPVWRTNVNAGVYVVDRAVQDFINTDENIDITVLFQRLIESDQHIVMFPIFEKLFEIGTAEKYNGFLSGNEFNS